MELFVVWHWCMDLNDCDVVWSCRDPGGAEPAGDVSAADNTIYNFFPCNECHPILVFWVISIICHLSLECKIFLLSQPNIGTCQGLLFLHSNHLELQVYPSWESLLWCYQAAYRTVCGLKLVHGPEWLWCCMVSLRSGWRWVCWRCECSWWYYLQLLSMQCMSPHTSFSSLLRSTRSCVPHPW